MKIFDILSPETYEKILKALSIFFTYDTEKNSDEDTKSLEKAL